MGRLGRGMRGLPRGGSRRRGEMWNLDLLAWMSIRHFMIVLMIVLRKKDKCPHLRK